MSALPGVFTGNGDLSACSGADAIVAGSTLDYVGTLAHPLQFETLSDAQQASITAATAALLANDVTTAGAQAAGAGYAVVPLRLPTECLWALVPGLTSPAGQATLLVRPRHRYDLAFEAPHVPNDFHTDQEVALLFDLLGARVVMIAGANRCAVTTPSGCHANTECLANGTAVQSDLAHAVSNAFQAMHLAVATPPALTHAIQFHANVELELNGDATISDTLRADDSAIAAGLATALAAGTGRDIRNCDDPVHPPPGGEFCGDGNAQGLASNGAANACTANATSASQLFFFMEQDSQDLDDYVGWSERVASAIAATFAPVPLDDDAGASVDATAPADAAAPEEASAHEDGGGSDDGGEVGDH